MDWVGGRDRVKVSRGVLARVPRLLWILGAGLLLGLAGAVSGLLVSGGHVGAAPTIPAGCGFASNTATITLGSGTTTVAANAAGQLIVTIPGQAAAQCPNSGTLGGSGPSGITGLAFQLTSPTAPASDTLIIDETAAQIPCSVTVNGTVGSGNAGSAVVDIKGSPSADITVGSNSLNFGNCTSSQGHLTGIASLKLEPRGDATVSTLGLTNDPAGVPTTFVAGQVVASGDTETFEADNPGSKLDFSQAYATCPQLSTVPPSTTTFPGTCGLNISDSNGTAVMNDTSTQTTDTLIANYDFSTGASNISSFVGLQSGSTVFGGAAGTFTLTNFQGGSQVLADAGTENYTVAASNSLFVGGSEKDTFSVTGNNNTFQAESGADSFFDIVPSGTTPSNTLDFSDVATSSSAPLVVNASGALQTVGATTLDNGQAAVGTPPTTYNFLDGATSSDATNFTSIKGASNGNTQFLVGDDGGLSLTGQGSGSSADAAMFFGNTGAVVNLSGGPQTTSAQISPTVTLSNFSLGLNQVLVGSPPAGTTSCAPTICDTLINIPTVTGPPGGFTTFFAGVSPTAFTFTDSGNSNTFIGGSGQDTFNSGGNFNTFVPGSGSATFTESTSAQGASNTIDFSNVPVGNATGCTGPPCSLTVNVSGSPTVVSNFQAAVLSSGQALSTYSFGGNGGGPDFTRFISADDGATTFQGGLGNYTYTGQGPGNSLDFSKVASNVASTLSFDVTHTPSPQATLANVPETFSGITNLVGLPGGNTTFVGGSTGGYTFAGNGTGNQASFAAEQPSNTLSVNVSQPSGGPPLTGGTVTFSLPGGAVLCSSVPVQVSAGNGTAACSTSSLPAGNNDQVVAAYTPPSGSSVGGSGTVIAATGTQAGAPPATQVTNVSIPSSPVQAGTTQTLSGTVSSVDGHTFIAAGTLTFSIAGGQTLCTARVNGGSTASGAISCSATFPPGTFDVIPIYTPSTKAVSGSAASQVRVTANPPGAQSTTSAVTYSPLVLGSSCNSSLFLTDCVSATVSPASASGTVTFSLPGSPNNVILCSARVNAGTAECSPQSNPLIEANLEIVATFTPDDPSVLSSSAAVSPPIASTFFNVTAAAPTVTSASVSPATVVQGVTESLSAVVTGGSSPNNFSLPGGQVLFSEAGGPGLCSAPVPSGSVQATVECSVNSFPTVGFADIVAEYIPPPGSVVESPPGNVFFGLPVGTSGSNVPIFIGAPAASSTTGDANQDNTAGVVANLSSTPFPAPRAGATVMVNGGQVLVAAPSLSISSTHGTTSCAVSPLPSFCDSLLDTSVLSGSTLGGNTFIAGPTSETFNDSGTSATDTINFANVATSTSTPLTVNLSGGPVNVAGSGTLANFTAAAGSNTYSFVNNGADFTTFTGSTGGNTTYLGGGTGGYNLAAMGTNDRLDLSADQSGATVDLTGMAMDANNPCDNTGMNGCVTRLGKSGSGSTSDTISGLTTVIGSAGGNNVFEAGAATYDFTGNGNNNTFVGGSGTDTFRSNGNNNVFQAGGGSASFIDATGTGNKVDFSQLTSAVTVNVSPVPVSVTSNDTATVAVGSPPVVSAMYDFTSFGSTPATFVGSPKGTTFFAGAATNQFQGQANTSNILSFADAPGNSLQVCVVQAVAAGCSSPLQAVLGSIDEGFQNITEFDGLATGNTTFVAGDPDGTSFKATGTNNAVDFSQAQSGINASVTLDPTTARPTGSVSEGVLPTSTPADQITGMTTVTGSGAGGNKMQSGTGPATYTFTANGNNNKFTGGSGTDSFSSTGNSNVFTVGMGPRTTLKDGGTQNTIDFGNVPTSSNTPLEINASGTPVNGILNDTAVAGSLSYDFTNGGPGFTILKGPATGNTVFSAPGAAAGYQFLGAGLKNTLDMSANVCGLTANMVSNNVALKWTAPGQPAGSCANSGTDIISDIASVMGSQLGPNVFDAGLQGTSFTAASLNNTLSYAALTNPGVCVNLIKDQVTQSCFSATGSTDSFTFAPGSLTVEGSPGADTFQIGPAPVTIDGGGGNDNLDLTSYGSAAVVDLNGGTIKGSIQGNVTFTPAFGCTSSINTTDLCVGTITGAPAGDTFIANQTLSTASALTLNGSGSDTLDLRQMTQSATVDMPIAGGTNLLNQATCNSQQSPLGFQGAVCLGPQRAPGILFTGITNLSGTSVGADHVFAGLATVGTANFTEPASPAQPGTLDYSVLQLPSNPTNSGLTFTVSGSNRGTVSNTAQQQAIGNFSGFANFVGTDENDSFVQNVTGSYNFQGGDGDNSLDVSRTTSGTNVALSPATLPDGCATRDANDGMVNGTGTGVSDTFSCIGSLTGSASTLNLVGDTASSGVTVALPSGTGPGSVTGDFTLSFAGISSVEGTPNTDTFKVGTAPMTLEGGGGHDQLDLSSYGSAAAVDLNVGSIKGSSLGNTTFTAGCASATQLCVTGVTGTPFADTFIVNQSGLISGTPPLSITGNGGNDDIDMSQVPSSATFVMPIPSLANNPGPPACRISSGWTGAVCPIGGSTPAVNFTGIPNATGTSASGDYFYAGTGATGPPVSLTEEKSTNPGTLDYSLVPAAAGAAGIVVDVTAPFTGSVTSGQSTIQNATFTNFGTFVGTPDNDSFFESAGGLNYNINGGLGVNSLDLTGAPSNTVDLSAPDPGCAAGSNDGTATGSGISVTFECMSNVGSSTSEYLIQPCPSAAPCQFASIDGRGVGKLMLMGDTTGGGVTITMPAGSKPGTVTGDHYSFSFTGMSEVDGTQYSDVFVPGTANALLSGGGGDDWISYAGAPAAARINLSGTQYAPGSGPTSTSIAADTATGGWGGVMTLNGISNVMDSSFGDTVVGGPGSNRLTGGTGNDTFVATGGNYVIDGGAGANNTIDLSLLSGQTTLNLGLSGPQALGTGDGTIALVPGTIETAIASPAGSTLYGGNGNNVTLVGGPGPDQLAAGGLTNQTVQTLIGNGGADTLVAGIGTDTLIGGADAVTFIPGQGTDTLEGNVSGNTLSYQGVPFSTPWKRPPLTLLGGARVNLSPTANGGLLPGRGTGAWGATVILSSAGGFTDAGITNVEGSPAADTFVTGSGQQTIDGNGGNDLFVVNGDDNQALIAGPNSASRFMFEGTVTGNTVFGNGDPTAPGNGDSTVDFSQAPSGVTVDLQATPGLASDANGDVQTLWGVLNVVGSPYSDQLVAGAPGATINGDGAKSLPGAPSTPLPGDFLQTDPNGGDTLTDSSGSNTFCAAAGCELDGTAGGHQRDILQGGSGPDTFFAHNSTPDTINGGGGTNNEADVDASDSLTNIQLTF